VLVLTHGLVNLITHRANEICFDLLGIRFLLELQGLRLQLLLQLDGQQRLLPALLSVTHYKFPQSSQIALKTVDRALHVHTRSFCTLVRCIHSIPLEVRSKEIILTVHCNCTNQAYRFAAFQVCIRTPVPSP
jgi:hypothetical protein